MKLHRVLVIGLAVLLLTFGRSGAQQTPVKIPRVRFLTSADNERTRTIAAFREGLRDLGYAEGRNILLEFRFAAGALARGLKLVAELVNLPVDVIVTERVPAAYDPSVRVPIVAPALMDPVERGFYASEIWSPSMTALPKASTSPISSPQRRLPILSCSPE